MLRRDLNAPERRLSAVTRRRSKSRDARTLYISGQIGQSVDGASPGRHRRAERASRGEISKPS